MKTTFQTPMAKLMECSHDVVEGVLFNKILNHVEDLELLIKLSWIKKNPTVSSHIDTFGVYVHIMRGEYTIQIDSVGVFFINHDEFVFIMDTSELMEEL